MMSGHHAPVPNEYAGLSNPIPDDDGSLARGGEIYTKHCATCHGDYGNGDGPGGASLDPGPAPIGHTSQMMSDAYLFWRVTEGGVPFETRMVPYRDILDENARWDVINYIRALGSGRVQPGSQMGGIPFDQASELAQRNQMLNQAVEDNVIMQNEADAFDLIHKAIDEFTQVEGISGVETSGGRADALPQILDSLVAAGKITIGQKDTFLDVHDRLVEAGLMQ
jgi:mono/diheme cytochrome c family protein